MSFRFLHLFMVTMTANALTNALQWAEGVLIHFVKQSQIVNANADRAVERLDFMKENGSAPLTTTSVEMQVSQSYAITMKYNSRHDTRKYKNNKKKNDT